MGLELQRCFRIGFHGLVKPLNRVVVPKRIQLVEVEIGPVKGQFQVGIAHQLLHCLIKSNLVCTRDASDLFHRRLVPLFEAPYNRFPPCLERPFCPCHEGPERFRYHPRCSSSRC
jgi:hypothetical protein